jgi:hypothetical protein
VLADKRLQYAEGKRCGLKMLKRSISFSEYGKNFNAVDEANIKYMAPKVALREMVDHS